MATSILLLVASFLFVTSCSPDEPVIDARTSSISYDLASWGSVGRSQGSLVVVQDGTDSHVCWRFTLERLPKAVQLHQDETGPTDPVVVSFYEPPGSPKSAGCTPIEPDFARDVHDGPEGFYVDAHNTEKTSEPVLWASLEESDDPEDQ